MNNNSITINSDDDKNKKSSFSFAPVPSFLKELNENSKLRLNFDKQELILNNRIYFKLKFEAEESNNREENLFTIDNDKSCHRVGGIRTKISILSGPHQIERSSNPVSRDNSNKSTDSKPIPAISIIKENEDRYDSSEFKHSPQESNSGLKRKLTQMLDLNTEDTDVLYESQERDINKLINKLNQLAKTMHAQFELSNKIKSANPSPETYYNEEREVLKSAIEKFSQIRDNIKKPNFAASKLPNPKLPLPNLSDDASRNSIQTPTIVSSKQGQAHEDLDEKVSLKEFNPEAWNRLDRWKKLTDPGVTLVVPTIDSLEAYNTAAAILDLRKGLLDKLRRRFDAFYAESNKLHASLEEATSPMKKSVTDLVNDIWLKVGGKGDLLNNLELYDKLDREYTAIYNAALNYQKSNNFK